VGGVEVSLLSGEVAQVGERTRDAPPVARLTELGEALLVEAPGAGRVPLLARHVPLLVERPRRTGPVAELAREGKTFLEEGARLGEASLQAGDAGEVRERAGDGDRVAQVLPENQALLEERARLLELPLLLGAHGDGVQGHGGAARVLELAADLERFLVELPGRREIDAEHAQCEEPARPQARPRGGRRQREQFLQERPALVLVLALVPVLEERACQAQAPLRLAPLDRPFERRSEVLALDLELLEPWSGGPAFPGGAGGAERGRRRGPRDVSVGAVLCEDEAVGGVRGAGERLVPARFEPLLRVLADRLEQEEAGLPASGRRFAQEALVQQRPRPAERVEGPRLARRARGARGVPR